MAIWSEWNIRFDLNLNERPKGAFRSGPADADGDERLVNSLATR